MKQLATEKSAGIEHDRSPSIPLLLASAAGIGAVYVIAQPSRELLYYLSNGLPPILAIAAFAIAAAGLIRNGVNVRDRVSSVWVCYSLGVLLWFLGESTWAVYALWYSVPNPFPSLADVFWLAGYIPLLFAIVMQVWPFREFFSSRKMLVLIATVLVMAALSLGALIPPTYASEVGGNLVSVVVALGYPLLDVALLLVALPILFLFGRGVFWRPFLFITVGVILTFIGDILFGWATLNGFYYDGSFYELFFHWSYLTLMYGFYLRFKSGTGPSMLE